MQVLERNHQKRSWCWRIRIETGQWQWDNNRSSNTQHLMSAVCGFCYSNRSPACVPTCLPSATCTTWSLQQRRIKLFAKASGIVGIQCTVGPNWPPLCARRSFRQHTATDALTIVLNSSSLVVHTQSEGNTVHVSRSRERRKCRRSSTGYWATKSHLATFFSAANSLKRPIHSLQFEHLLYRSLAPWTENSLHLSEDLAEGWRLER